MFSFLGLFLTPPTTVPMHFCMVQYSMLVIAMKHAVSKVDLIYVGNLALE